MKLQHFIDRPILSMVISVVIFVAGLIGLYALSGTQDVQSGADSTGRHTFRFCTTLYIGMHFLCDDLLYLYPPPRSLHDDICIHFRAVAIHFGHFMARFRHS